MATTKITRTLVKVKDTKNKVVYGEQSEADDAITGIYFPKPLIEKLGNPSQLTVTVEAP